jgi:hypothetical protein
MSIRSSIQNRKFIQRKWKKNKTLLNILRAKSVHLNVNQSATYVSNVADQRFHSVFHGDWTFSYHEKRKSVLFFYSFPWSFKKFLFLVVFKTRTSLYTYKNPSLEAIERKKIAQKKNLPDSCFRSVGMAYFRTCRSWIQNPHSYKFLYITGRHMAIGQWNGSNSRLSIFFIISMKFPIDRVPSCQWSSKAQNLDFWVYSPSF